MGSDSICTTCGYRGMPKKFYKGSFLMEIALWLLFLIPGFIYSLWRQVSKFEACPACKKPTMIPVNTPIGKKLTS